MNQLLKLTKGSRNFQNPCSYSKDMHIYICSSLAFFLSTSHPILLHFQGFKRLGHVSLLDNGDGSDCAMYLKRVSRAVM